MPTVPGLCPGRAQCKNYRDFTDLGRHLNAVHVKKLVLPDNVIRNSGFVRHAPCGKYYRAPPPGQSIPHACKPLNIPGDAAALPASQEDDAESIDSFQSAEMELPSRPATPEHLPEDPVPAAASATDPASGATMEDIPSIVDMSEEEAAEFYKTVAQAPAMLGILPFFMSRDWTAMSDHLAGLYLNNTSGGVRELVRLLACPKIVLSPLRNRGIGADTLTQRMHKAEFLPLPGQAIPPDRTAALASSTLADRVSKKIRMGRLRQAARTLGEDGWVHPLTEETILALRRKHPSRRAKRFKRRGLAPPPSLQGITPDVVRATIKTLRKDTSGGAGGWTVPLLQLSAKSDRFCLFIATLTQQMANGTAPARQQLTSAILIPFAKDDGGVRPICIPELIYRVSAKLLMAHYRVSDSLLPCQLGVGSAGGTEPSIRLGDRLVEGQLPGYTHISSIDIKNAFNSLERESIDDAVHEHCGDAYRFAKWRYEQEAELFVMQNGHMEIILSQQGVQQGDPFGPFFFSVSIRNLIKRLQAFLGEDCIVVFYLDDGYIFSKEAGTLERVKEFFRGESEAKRSCGLELNEAKCKEMSKTEILESGMAMLGSMIGSRDARAKFLNDSIVRESAKIGKLAAPPKQDAFLLLQQCVQHNLRHLLRVLRTDDLPAQWMVHDHELHAALRQLRDSGPRRGPHDGVLFSLPLKNGGCGVPKFSDLSPLARASSRQSADQFLRDTLQAPIPPRTVLFPQVHEGDEAAGVERVEVYEEEIDMVSQQERCRTLYKTMEDELLKKLPREQAASVAENGSRLARRALTTIPFTQRTQLQDPQVQVWLYIRTLLRRRQSTCSDCGQPNAHDHDDVCVQRVQRYNVRHDGVRNLIARGLRHTKRTQVLIEPPVEERFGQRRTDLRVAGLGAETGSSIEF
ncbi:unnamed protein product, partial [Tilletia controversa]